MCWDVCGGRGAGGSHQVRLSWSHQTPPVQTDRVWSEYDGLEPAGQTSSLQVRHLSHGLTPCEHSAADWEVEFDKYRESPEFKWKNSQITLNEFKFIW